MGLFTPKLHRYPAMCAVQARLTHINEPVRSSPNLDIGNADKRRLLAHD